MKEGMNVIPNITLANGLQMPAIGFGSYKVKDGSAADQIADAIRTGYRLLDTASFYGNEEEVGEGIRRSGIDRRELFVTTKAWRDEMGYENVLTAFERSCQRLGVDYVDLYLLHWPAVATRDPDWQHTNAESWRALEELYAAGKVRAIGVSNFLPQHLDELLKTAKIVPMVNQIEYHPGWTQDDVVAYCKARSIAVEAWSPMGRGRVFSEPLVVELAEKYGCNVGQLCLRYDLQNGVIPLPKSSHVERMEQNLNIFGFAISEEDMTRLDALENVGWSGEDPATQLRQNL